MFDNVQNGYWRIHAKENLFAQCKGSANLLQSLFITACFQQGISYSPYTTLSNTACRFGQHGQLMSWCRNVAQHGVQVGSWSREQLPGQTGYQLQHSNTINTAVAASYSVEQRHHTTTAVVLWCCCGYIIGQEGEGNGGGHQCFDGLLLCAICYQCYHVRDDKI